MAKSDGYEVLVDELTVHKAVGTLTDPITGRELGIQQGSGKTYFKGEVIPASDVSPLLIQALEDEDHPSHDSASKKLAVAGSSEAKLNTSQRLGMPFAGYDDMDEEDIVSAMSVLPSRAIQSVKRYESENENRERIVHFNVGFGESPQDRQEGRVGSELDEDGRDDADKVAADLTTREVPEEGVVQVGDGITGTGDPAIPHGSQKEEGEKKPASRRRSRRTRSASQQGGDEGSGSGDDSSDNE